MKNIFIGLIFVVFDLTLDLDSFTLNLMPNFIGYILWLNAFKELSVTTPSFAKIKPYAFIGIIFSSISFVFNGLGITHILDYIVQFIILYMVISSIRDLELSLHKTLKSKSLFKTYLFYVSSYVITLSTLGFIIPFFPSLMAISILTLLINFAAMILVIVSFYKTKKLYDAK